MIIKGFFLSVSALDNAMFLCIDAHKNIALSKAETHLGEAILMSTNNICAEAILMSTNNKCFYGEIRRIIS